MNMMTPTRSSFQAVVFILLAAKPAAATTAVTGPAFVPIQSSFVKPEITLVPTRRNRTRPTQALNEYKSPKSSPLEDEPWKSDDSYWDMLQEASKDPATFDKFVAETVAMKHKKSKSGRSSRPSATSLMASKTGTNGDGTSEKPKKKNGYQRVEDWDAQRNGENMTAEERLQWECQRGGDRFRQNEILRHNLNSF